MTVEAFWFSKRTIILFSTCSRHITIVAISIYGLAKTIIRLCIDLELKCIPSTGWCMMRKIRSLDSWTCFYQEKNAVFDATEDKLKCKTSNCTAKVC